MKVLRAFMVEKKNWIYVVSFWNWMWIVNKIGDEGARMISEGLKNNSTLTKLNLSCDEKNGKEERKETE